MTQETVYIRLDRLQMGDVLVMRDGSEELVARVFHLGGHVEVTLRNAKGDFGLRNGKGDMLCEILPRVPAPTAPMPTRFERDVL